MEPIIIKHLTGSKSGQINFFDIGPGEELTIGRDPSNKLAFHQKEDDLVGRKHAKIIRQADDFIIVDLYSRNGTIVNSKRIASPTKLKSGDVIEFGAGGPKVQFYTGYESLSGPATRMIQPEQPKAPPTRMILGGTPVSGSARLPVVEGKHERVILKHLTGSKSGQVDEYELSANDEVTIGRDPSNTLGFDQDKDDLVGRKHAKLIYQGGHFVIIDLTSRNGTLVNGDRIMVPTRLKSGDIIEFGAGGPKVQFYRGEVMPVDSSAQARPPNRLVTASDATLTSPLGALETPILPAAEQPASEAPQSNMRTVVIAGVVLFFITVGIGLYLGMVTPTTESETGEAEGSILEPLGGESFIVIVGFLILLALIGFFISRTRSD
jgi:pSer/pThr/pTyr-binding forkhead associated (FHA) protein